MNTLVLAVIVSLHTPVACPIPAPLALPELIGTWRVLTISGLDRARRDTLRAVATIAPDLDDCLLIERFTSATSASRYQAMMIWGTNGSDSTVQRVFVHAGHGRLGVYQGRRRGQEIALRQQDSPPQPGITVEHVVRFLSRSRFTITSRLSRDGGRTWSDLARWDYQREAR